MASSRSITTTEEDRATERYNVIARRWKHGWELHIEGLGVTQSKTLATADAMVRDYIESLTDRAVPSDAVITITPDLGAIGEQVTNMNSLYALADRSEREASGTKQRSSSISALWATRSRTWRSFSGYLEHACHNCCATCSRPSPDTTT